MAEEPQSFSRVEVCNNPSSKDCKRKGSAKTWVYFQKLVEGTGIELSVSDCMNECTSGPNVRLDGDDRRIIGGVKSMSSVASILGVNASEFDA